MIPLHQLRAGVIGTGFIGPVHIEALKRLGVQVTAVCGSTASARECAHRWGIPEVYGDYDVDALVRSSNVDVIHITSPNKAHVAQSLKALRAGKHVVCEKPLGMSSRETARVVAAVQKPNAPVFAVNYMCRFFPAILQLRAMVARGDLGVEIPAQSVPIAQKRIIKLCNIAAKPVITATQMLESMIHNPRPTRAEASDVANAVLDGTDAVMLSAETSVGAYPVEAVHYMRTICTEAERELADDGLLHESQSAHYHPTEANTDSIAMAAARIAEEHRVAAIVSLSYSGRTSRLISNRRPRTPILAVTTDLHVARHMNLNWGVVGMIVEKTDSTDDMIERIKDTLVKKKFFARGSIIVFTIGRPLVGRAKTNMLSIETL
jgi:pyruvate kinase